MTLTTRSVFTFVWVPETKAVPIECMEALFSNKMRHRAWMAKKLYPPHGIPPLPDNIAAGQAAYIEAHQGKKPVDDDKSESEQVERA